VASNKFLMPLQTKYYYNTFLGIKRYGLKQDVGNILQYIKFSRLQKIILATRWHTLFCCAGGFIK
jgi:hypothetical protein